MTGRLTQPSSLLIILLAASLLTSCGEAAQPFHDEIAEGMTLEEAVHSIHGTASAHPRSWIGIFFQCSQPGCEVFVGWDKESPASQEDLESILSELQCCPAVKVHVRSFGHRSTFSFDVDSGQRIESISDMGGAAT